MHTPRSNAGFTLIEMAIVLAIIGLLIGGVIAGKYLLRQTEMQSVVSDFTKYKTAFDQFKLKYGGLPGDLLDATDYWGSAGGNGSDATCYGIAKRTPATCNGNGNGSIDGNPGDYTDASGITLTPYVEMFLAWQHLANAGLVTGSYSGRTETPVFDAGVNLPAGKITGTYFYMNKLTPRTGDTYFYDVATGVDIIGFQGDASGGGYRALTPREARAVDTKLDDGLPTSGVVFSLKKSASNCTTADVVDASTKYDLTKTVPNCPVIMSTSVSPF